jgi:hypothetical protein
MWPAKLGGWRVMTDGGREPLVPTQVTSSWSGIWVSCLPFTRALPACLCSGCNCSKIKQEVQNKTKSEPAAAQACRRGQEDGLAWEGSEVRVAQEVPGTGR